MPLQKGHEKSLAIETRKAKAKKESTEARRSHICRPNGEPSTRVDRTNGGFLNKTACQTSHMGFVYLQKTCSAEETIEAKRAFEQYAENRGVRVQAYHADNGIFQAKIWVEECQQRKQDLTFAGVNAHHQNGVVERRIRELQETTRAMLIHATKDGQEW